MSHHRIASPVSRPATRRRALALMAGALALLAVGAPARADVPPPDVDVCKSKNVGDACFLQSTPRTGASSLVAPVGVCRASTCMRPDYTNWDRDASASPPIVNYDCVKCVDPKAAPDGGTDATTDSGTTGTGGKTGTGGNGSGGATGTGGSVVDPMPPAANNGGCSLSGVEGARQVAPWLMVGAFGLLVSCVRRRRR